MGWEYIEGWLGWLRSGKGLGRVMDGCAVLEGECVSRGQGGGIYR